mmetsp:Transcript_41238/g.94877  ORF Transcript_41238/g.94877 Transcript_41238/m.94877 type:complete len:448 (-) Transcript_41238:3-1346(-)
MAAMSPRRVAPASAQSSPRTRQPASARTPQAGGQPARLGLHKTLQLGSMRNPLSMSQNASPWQERHLADAAADDSRPGNTASPRTVLAARGGDKNRIPRQGMTLAGLGIISSKQKSSERGVGMLQPQRIELPSFLHMPPRRPDDAPPLPEEKAAIMNRIKDLDHLIFACRRASKQREEGRAHFSLGVLRDNLGHFRKAIDSYGNFLKICQQCGDGQGSALAYHCLAVDYQLLGQNDSSTTSSGAADVESSREPASAEDAIIEDGRSSDLSKRAIDWFRKSIAYHNKHREVSDAVGKFVAHLNMGLAYSTLGERESSTVNFQYALRYALQLQSLEGQSLAIGSLSFSKGMYENDAEKMRALIERYVDLCDALKQSRNQAAAFRKLGIIAGQQGDNDQSIDYFQQAIKAARSQGDREAEKDCSVRIGIAAGHAKMAEHVSSILSSSVGN